MTPDEIDLICDKYIAREAEFQCPVEFHPHLREALHTILRRGYLPEATARDSKVVGYMNEDRQLMTVDEYERHLKPEWKWAIDQHWTPVAPVYAGEFIDRPLPQNRSTPE